MIDGLSAKVMGISDLSSRRGKQCGTREASKTLPLCFAAEAERAAENPSRVRFAAQTGVLLTEPPLARKSLRHRSKGEQKQLDRAPPSAPDGRP